MIRRFSRFLIILILLFITSVVFLFVLYSYTPVVDHALERLINVLINHNIQVKFRGLSGNWLGRLKIDDLRVISGDDTLYCKSVEFDYQSMDLLRNRFIFEQIVLIEPTIILTSEGSDTFKINQNASEVLDSLIYAIDLTGIPLINIRRFIVKNGQMRFRRRDHEERFENIQMELAGMLSERKVEIRPRYIRGRWGNRGLDVGGISFHLIGNRKRVTLNQLEVRVADANITGHGEVEFYPRFRFLLFADTSRIHLPLINKFVSDLPYKKGFVEIYGSFIGVPNRFWGELFIQARLDSLTIRRFQMDYRLRDGTFYFTNIQLRSNFGDLSGQLSVSPVKQNEVKLEFARFDLKKLGVYKETTELTGNLNLNFDRWVWKKITGRGSLLLQNLRFGNSFIDSVLLQISAQKGEWRIHYPSKIIVGRTSRFFTEGTFSSDQNLDLTLQTENNNLNTLFTRLGVKDFRGNGSLHLRLTGPLIDPDLSGRLFLDSLAYKNLIGYRVMGNLQVEGLRIKRKGKLFLNIPIGRINEVPMRGGILRLRLDRNIVRVDTLSFYNEKNFVFTTGQISRYPDSLLIKIHQFELQYENYTLKNSTPLLAKVSQDTIYVRNWQFQAPQSGILTLRGFLALHAFSDLKLSLRNIQLEPFSQYFNWKYVVKGITRSDIELAGEFDNPVIKMNLVLEEVFLDQYFVGSLIGKIQYRDRRLLMQKFRIQQNSTSFLDLAGYIDLQFVETERRRRALSPENSIKLSIQSNHLQLEDYAFLFDVNFPLKGDFTATIDLSGRLSRPQGKYILNAHGVQFRDYQFPQLYLAGKLDPKRILVEKGEINFMNTEIEASGYKRINWDFEHPENILANKEFRLRLKIEEDSLNFLGTLNPEVDRITGDISIIAQVEGPIDQPRLLETRIRIKNGKLYLYKVENAITDLDIEGHLEGSRLIFDKLSGRSSKVAIREGFLRRWIGLPFRFVKRILGKQAQYGKIEGKGFIDLTQFFHPKFDLRFVMSKAYFNYFIENTRLVVSTNRLNITGRDTITVTGRVKIDEGEVELDFTEMEKNVLLASTIRETPPYLQYILDIELPGRFFVRSTAPFNIFDIQLTGNLGVIQEARSDIEMTGTLEIVKGKYFIQVEEFEVQSGKIEFLNPKELPLLNVFAQKRKFGLIFDLNVRGRLDDPIKEIKIRDANTHQELIYPDVKDQMALLMFGVTFQELGNQAQSALLQKGEEVLTQTVMNQIENEARHFIGLDQVRFEQKENVIAFRDRRLNMASEVPLLALGKYLTSNLYLEYKTRLSSAALPGVASIPTPRLSWQPGNQIYMEYRINRNWSVATFYQRTLQGNDRVKFDIRWNLSF